VSANRPNTLDTRFVQCRRRTPTRPPYRAKRRPRPRPPGIGRCLGDLLAYTLLSPYRSNARCAAGTTCRLPPIEVMHKVQSFQFCCKNGEGSDTVVTQFEKMLLVSQFALQCHADRARREEVPTPSRSLCHSLNTLQGQPLLPKPGLLAHAPGPACLRVWHALSGSQAPAVRPQGVPAGIT